MRTPPPLPAPSRGRLSAAIMAVLATAGLALLTFAFLTGSDDDRTAAVAMQSPTSPVANVTTPTPSSSEAAKATSNTHDKVVGKRRSSQRQARTAALKRPPLPGWIESFYPIYAEAQRVYGVSWLLLASIHRQETAFSTHPTTYRSLNFAGCCGGPMQFNVTNGDKKGRGSTWDRYRHSYRAGNRPARYLSKRSRHPSLYDDFDAMMAAAHLLKDNGAGTALDATAWRAAYNYYGHDFAGIDYANQVVARAIDWARTEFCAGCGDRPQVTARIDAAWGSPVRTQMLAAERARASARSNQTTNR